MPDHRPGQEPLDMRLVADVLDHDPLMTAPEAARFLGISPATLRRRGLPQIRVGQVRYRTSVIRAAKAAQDARQAR